MLLGPEERSALATARKAEDPQRRMATASLASWPWLQDLRVSAGRSYGTYDMGRMLAVALRVDSDSFASSLERLARDARARDRAALTRSFRAATDSGNLSALLLEMGVLQRSAHHDLQTAFEVAHGNMSRFPKCPLMVEVAAGRDCQRNRVNSFFDSLGKIVRQAADLKPSHEYDQYTAGAYLSFVKGYMDSVVATSATDKQYLQAGANFGGASGAGSCGGAGGYGGGGGGVGGSSSPPPYGAGGSGSATPGGGGNTPRGGAQSGAQRGGQGQGKGTPPAPRATQAAQQKQVKNQQQQQKAANISYGVHAPCSKTIVGETIGLDGPGPNFTCWGCNTAGGHFKGECPTLWGQRGKPLPGFNKDGDREPGAWNGDE